MLLLLVTALAMLAGCQEQARNDDGVIRFVTWKPNQPRVWQEIYRRFSQEHPGLRVRPEVGPHSSTALHDLLTQKLKNQSPEVDVFLMDVTWPPEFGSAGWALALDQYFPPQERRLFLEGAILANTYQGHIYGVPLYVDSGLLYYRQDLLAAHGLKPPGTWPELASQAALIVNDQAGQGRALVGYSGQFQQYEGLVCDMLEFVHGHGGHVLGQGDGACCLGQPAALAAVGFVRDQIIGLAAPRGVLTYQEPESLALFAQGRAVFLRSWPYAWALLADARQSRVAGRVGIAPLPRFDQGASVATLGGWQVGISPFSPRRRAAWQFVRFLTSPAIQKLLAVEAAWAPTRRALYDDPQVLAAQPQLAAMRQVFADARPRPRSPLYPAISNALQRYFHKAICDPRSDIPGLASQACREINGLTALAGAK